MRDSQKTRVYRWQRFVWKDKRVAIDEYTAKQLVLRYTTGIRVRFDRRRTATATANWNTQTISFPVAGMGLTREVVLHEVAHMLVRKQYGYQGVQGHGPQFVKALMGLLEEHGYDRNKMRMAALMARVNFYA